MRELNFREFTISQSAKVFMATLNWTAALVLLSAVTFADLPLAYCAWSIICALWGSVFVGWAMLVRERLALEHLVDIAIGTYVKNSGSLHLMK